MADGTAIEWTDATWNPITGCAVVSPGCTNCYAMKLAGTRLRHHPSRAGLTRDTKAGPVWTGEVRFNEQWLLDPLRWTKPRRIFVCAHADLFGEDVPDEWIDRIFAVMALAPQHQFQVLTKRAERMRAWFSPDRYRRHARAERIRKQMQIIRPGRIGGLPEWPLLNVWLGVSVEDQARADERIPHLLATPAAVRWLSCEPLLGPVDLTRLNFGRDEAQAREVYCRSEDAVTAFTSWWNGLTGEFTACEEEGEATDLRPHGAAHIDYPAGLDWVVAGGESGPGARPMHPDWARSLRDQCAAAGVPFLFKQWGEWAPGDAFGLDADRPFSDKHGNVRDWMSRYVVARRGHADERGDRLRAHSFTGHATNLVYAVGKKRAGRMLDGVQHDGYPAPVLSRVEA
jgi:protein gp37